VPAVADGRIDLPAAADLYGLIDQGRLARHAP